MMRLKLLAIFLFSGLVNATHGQKLYKIDASDVMRNPEEGYFKMGNPGNGNHLLRVNSLYLKLNYWGDRAELYNGYQLSADNFNDNRSWSIGLNRLEQSVEGRNLRLVIYSLSPDSKIFFDQPPAADAYTISKLTEFRVVPEYKFIMK